MSARPRKSTVLFIAACAIIVPANAAKAEPLHYIVTDLGSGYQLQADASGHAFSVAGAGGGPGYVFDKSPTTQVNERQDRGGLRYSVTTLRNGQFTAGYTFDYGGLISTFGVFEGRAAVDGGPRLPWPR